MYLTKRHLLSGDVQAVGLGLTATRQNLVSVRTLQSASSVSLRSAVQVDAPAVSPAGPPAGPPHSPLLGPPVVRHDGQSRADGQLGGQQGEDHQPEPHLVAVISAMELSLDKPSSNISTLS